MHFQEPNPEPLVSSLNPVSQNPKPTADPPPPPPQEKKSFALATGELFLRIASRIILSGAGSDGGDPNWVPIAATPTRCSTKDKFYWRRRKEGIAALVENAEETEVIWEQRVKDVEAERRREAVSSPGFSFSAAGMLFPYHLGIAQFLIEKGYIKAVLRNILDKFLPEDIHIRSNGRIRVAVTQILWRPRGLLVDQFDSKEDLIDALFTSSFIPGYLAPRPATVFRNRFCVDGGLTLFMPPTSAAQTVCVCAFPASLLGLQGIEISPDCNPENRASPRELFNWALEPAEDHILDKLFELGYADAAAWAKGNPVEEIVKDDRQ
ncbi:uncharacterized protein LOC130754663 isoform X2 [Actinidia eriantha]|uniref:uncharacterized protein LOC130754663 isoform X2 n=1 Tax=Actinidia eriantha TaxID=165200 RepID=UPI00258F42C9|nr:uncharacterized protein LOC130754663 isoform X2 [Actinidia eriantha]